MWAWSANFLELCQGAPQDQAGPAPARGMPSIVADTLGLAPAFSTVRWRPHWNVTAPARFVHRSVDGEGLVPLLPMARNGRAGIFGSQQVPVYN